MKVKVNNKEVNIPNEVIENYVNKLEVSQEEAIQIYLEDEGILINEEQEALVKKGKETRITATIHQAKGSDNRKKREVVRKEDPVKENIINAVASFLETLDGVAALKIENVGKIITFSVGNDEFKLDLIKRRKK